MEQNQHHAWGQNMDRENRQEMKRITESVWRYLNHLKPAYDRSETAFGLPSFKELVNKAKERLMEGEPVMVAFAGPSGSGKSTISRNFDLVLQTDPELRTFKRNHRVPIMQANFLWSRFIKAYAKDTRQDFAFGRLSPEFMGEVSDYGVRRLEEMWEDRVKNKVPGIISVQVPGYPQDRGKTILESVAQHDGLICAPWAAREVYDLTATLRDVAHEQGTETAVDFMSQQDIEPIGDPAKIYRELTQDCAPGFAVRNMQADILQLVLQMISEGQVANFSRKVPLHQEFSNAYQTAFENDSAYYEAVIVKLILPLLVQHWGFKPENSFVCHNSKFTGVPHLSDF